MYVSMITTIRYMPQINVKRPNGDAGICGRRNNSDHRSGCAASASGPIGAKRINARVTRREILVKGSYCFIPNTFASDPTINEPAVIPIMNR
jgi:hypothetical protein